LDSCQSKPKMDHPYTNKLIHESSPYLLQHAHNPVDWYPWGDEALALAKKENKLLLISIGYSSCHWCHVMEHESFEDTAVAAFMNEHFINIKVDREERPDIDDVYMTACQLSSGGNCGWPLNSFALPDGRPVWAGTYFPKAKWLEVLDYFRGQWADDKVKMEDYANRLVEGVKDNGLDSGISGDPQPFTIEDVHVLAKQFKDRVDPQMGGRRGAPKFPMPNNWQYLMHYAYRYDDLKAKDLLLVTLDRMMMGGIYDQLEGGFARYSTDSSWLVPHFEKMLYDNGQLVSVYAQAYAWTGKKEYLDVVNQTLGFVKQNWTDPSGGFYSSYDADSEGVEGKYYVWTKEELEALIPEGIDRDLFFTLNDIRAEGNWEHKQNILQRHRRGADIAKQYKVTQEAFDESILKTNEILIEKRKTRIAPGLDDKILTSWNGLMLQGYVDAYRVTGDATYLETALKNASFIAGTMIKENYRLDRNYKNGKSTINGFLDDYASVIQAFISLYQSTFDQQWLDHADGLTQHVLKHFGGDPSGYFYFTSDLDAPLVARRIDIGDNVIPSANSMMARNLLVLGEMLYKEEYVTQANEMFNNIWPRLKKDAQPSFYSNWCQLMMSLIKPPYEIAIVGENYTQAQSEFLKTYQPDALFMGGKSEGTLPLLEHKLVEGETFIYVCQNKTCKRPVHTFQEALTLMAD
ncbi:MAG TPA: thioredoxin domain-containing protein, partial [Saprospiraceae bacterium]